MGGRISTSSAQTLVNAEGLGEGGGEREGGTVEVGTVLITKTRRVEGRVESGESLALSLLSPTPSSALALH